MLGGPKSIPRSSVALVKEIGEDEMLAASALAFVREKKAALMVRKWQELFTLEQRQQLLAEAEKQKK